jgi:hypothetical protein
MYAVGKKGINMIDYKTDNIPEWSELYRGKKKAKS